MNILEIRFAGFPSAEVIDREVRSTTDKPYTIISINSESEYTEVFHSIPGDYLFSSLKTEVRVFIHG